MSGIGLCGAHGVGKSTLAKAFVETHPSVTFIESKASGVIMKAGYDPAAEYDFATRLMLQELILDAAEESYRNHIGTFISDRTPLDFLTYLTTDILRNNVDEGLAGKYLNYRDRCFEVTNRYFNVVIRIQPGIEMVAREGRGSPNTAYIEHFNAVLGGFMASHDLTIQAVGISRSTTNLKNRVAAVHQSVNAAFRSFEAHAAMKGAILASKSIH